MLRYFLLLNFWVISNWESHCSSLAPSGYLLVDWLECWHLPVAIKIGFLWILDSKDCIILRYISRNFFVSNLYQSEVHGRLCSAVCKCIVDTEIFTHKSIFMITCKSDFRNLVSLSVKSISLDEFGIGITSYAADISGRGLPTRR